MPRRSRRVKDKESTAKCSVERAVAAGIGPGQGLAAVAMDHHSPEEAEKRVGAGLGPHFLEEDFEVEILDLDPRPDCQVVDNQELQGEEGSRSRY